MVTHVAITAPARDGASKLGSTPGGVSAAGVLGPNGSIVEGYVTGCFEIGVISGGTVLEQVSICDVEEGRQI